jgi:NAD(P)-dependent dehydrogenase (short-subunit alcohol dehydrogenase family)
MTLTSFGQDIHAVVFGASGGIGAALAAGLRDDPSVARLSTVSRGGETDHHCDYHSEDSIAATAEAIGADGPVHVVLVATGILHGDGIAPEKTWKALDADVMAQVFAINTIVPTMIAKHMLPRLATDRKSAFAALSARVGSISDNRLGGWLSYRASKAALNMSIKTLSIELARVNKHAIIFGLHPGTVETGLSQPFRGNVPTKQLFTPEHSANLLLETLDNAPAESTGTVLAYDGTRIVP